jgi:hypothetical protein
MKLYFNCAIKILQQSKILLKNFHYVIDRLASLSFSSTLTTLAVAAAAVSTVFTPAAAAAPQV